MRTLILSVVAVACLLNGAGLQESKAAPRPTGQQQGAMLHGSWKLVGGVFMGQPVDPAQVAAQKVQIEFVDGKLVTRKNGQLADTCTIRTDETQGVKHLDVTNAQGGVERAIFKVEGDTLTICFTPVGGIRPTTFESKAADKTSLLILKREPR